MGPMNQILSLMPGLNKKAMKNFNMDDRQISWTEAIISSRGQFTTKKLFSIEKNDEKNEKF